ncbi:SWR1-complex protein 4 [Aspergillus mulundensis]|uniref:SWR1-complex protein 4 n=1 Tax=Aspergillus mulundensis TaxID=1810919 RepID=A0A3D8Q808_9EURO|nr:SWR1-complex protein 4 [Aspergillus mulundensis]RDW57963.1 SWR1-complex protein 4 [Aspergillus mulundensis]
MAAADVRDMLDLPAEGQPRPHKKQKVVEKRPEGITRELFALLGERAPPIAINENRYKGRPKWQTKARVRPWRMTPFSNEARSDDLVLRHWQREPGSTQTPAIEDMKMEGETTEQQGEQKSNEPQYPFAKYNIKINVPKRYTTDEYNRHLRSDEWSREETDYLMDLVEEYHLRWVVIADRYDFQPRPVDNPDDNTDTSTALVPSKQFRTMEQMKARYYFIAASMLALETPPSTMSPPEFELHEMMTKFDPERERHRKELAALQLNRTADEVREETVLLEELKRIAANEQEFVTERRELYSRLDIPVSVSNATNYHNSQGLSHLLQTLLQADKSKKRRSILGPDGIVPTPGGQTPTIPNGPGSARDSSRADTPNGGTTQPATTKKAAAAANKEAAQQAIRTLTPAEEARYGVQHHDRLAPGVQFRSDRVQKLTQAKSHVQTQKLGAALAELEVPLRLVMPTERVVKNFEKLIHSVNLLLDARKVAEKVESEIRVLEAAKEERERKAKEFKEKDKPEVKSEQRDEDAPVPPAPVSGAVGSAPQSGQPVNASEGQANPDASSTANNPASGEPATKEKEGVSHKRSASVLSNGSDKSSKRQKK